MLLTILFSAVLSAGLGDSIHPSALDSVTIQVTPLDEFASPIEVVKNSIANSFYQSNIHLREYASNGGAQLLRLNGHSASRTQVNWNGFSIQSNSLGSTDLSLLPTYLIESIALNDASAGVTSGSSAIAGIVQLKTQSKAQISKPKYRVHSAYYPNQISILNAQFENRWKNTSLKVAGELNKSKGLYQFQDVFKANSPTEELTHNALNQTSFYSSFNQYFKTCSLFLEYFQLGKQKEIPRNLGDFGENYSEQSDSIYRVSSRLEFDHGNIGTMYEQHVLLFTDQLNDTSSYTIYSRVQNNQLQFQGQFEHKVGRRIQLNHSIEIKRLETISPNHKNGEVDRNELKYSIYLENNQKWTPNVGASVQYAEGFTIIPAFQISKQIRVWNKWTVQYSLGNVYRIPTMNDLYWAEGGNPELLPEEGYKLNLKFSTPVWQLDECKIQQKYAVFWSLLENGILWQPSNIGQFWSPSNVDQLMNAAYSIQTELTWKQATIDLNYQYTLAKAKNTKQDFQVPYSPSHSMSISGQIRFLQNFCLQTSYRWISEQFTESGNNPIFNLDAYGIFNAELQYRANVLKKTTLILGVSVQNLTNKAYQISRSYIQPGRNIQFNITLQNL